MVTSLTIFARKSSVRGALANFALMFTAPWARSCTAGCWRRRALALQHSSTAWRQWNRALNATSSSSLARLTSRCSPQSSETNIHWECADVALVSQFRSNVGCVEIVLLIGELWVLCFEKLVRGKLTTTRQYAITQPTPVTQNAPRIAVTIGSAWA